MQEDEVPRLAEIGRRIHEVGQNLTDFRNEVRSGFTEMVRKDTYAAERDAMRDRITALENRGRSTINLFYGAMATLAVTILTLWITRGSI